MTRTLFEALTDAGIETDHHESDLYFPITPASTVILGGYPLERGNATRFYNQITHTLWYDVPFAYTPWWEARCAKGAEVRS